MSDKLQNEDIKKTYLENRTRTIEDFNMYLDEAQKDSPSVGGKIAGMDFRQFSACCVFNIILEQEEYANKSSPYTNLKEEKAILKDLVKKAKNVFGKEYKIWYNKMKKRNDE